MLMFSCVLVVFVSDLLGLCGKRLTTLGTTFLVYHIPNSVCVCNCKSNQTCLDPQCYANTIYTMPRYERDTWRGGTIH